MNDSCGDVRARLLDLLDGALSEQHARPLRDHLAACEACGEEYRSLADGIAALPEAPRLRPPAETRRAVLAAARATGVSPPRRRRAGQRGQWYAVFGIVAGLAAVLVAAVILSPENTLMVPGDEVPSFHAVDVETGEEYTLADFEGEVVLLNIWATWCLPCEQEMPSMERLHRAFGPKGLRIVAVSVDQESTHKVQRWAEERGLTFTILHDRSGRIEQLYQTTGVPESFVIDRHGRLLKREIGPREWDAPRQTALFERLLASGPEG